MIDEQLETRLRSTMLDQASRVEPAHVSVASILEAARPADRRTRRPSSRTAVPVLGGVAAVAAAAVLTVGLGNHARHANRGPAAASVPAAESKVAAPVSTFTYVRETTNGSTAAPVETWIPADRSQTWQFTNPSMRGSARTDRGKCAAFPHYEDANGKVPDCSGGSWDMYRPQFAASLPDDPHAVLASMRTSTDGPKDADAFNTGWQFLGTGWLQAPEVVKVVDALKLIHDVRVTSAADGSTTLAYSGYLKPTVKEFFSVTVDSQHRVVSTGFSYGTTKTLNDTFAYKTVSALGDR